MLACRSTLAAFPFLAIAVLCGPAAAQILAKVLPNVGEPGDLVILRGTGLGGTTSVEFRGSVGGLAIEENISVAPIAVSDTEVLAVVPTFSGFLPGWADPEGSVSVTPSHGGELYFVFLQATFGTLSTPGIGTTQASGLGRPVVSLDPLDILIWGLDPLVIVDFWLENATPGSPAVCLIGLPAPSPYLPIGDGLLVVQFPPLVPLYPSVTDANGHAGLELFIPPGSVHGTFVAQWGLLEAGSLTLAVSNGFQFVVS